MGAERLGQALRLQDAQLEQVHRQILRRLRERGVDRRERALHVAGGVALGRHHHMGGRVGRIDRQRRAGHRDGLADAVGAVEHGGARGDRVRVLGRELERPRAVRLGLGDLARQQGELRELDAGVHVVGIELDHEIVVGGGGAQLAVRLVQPGDLEPGAGMVRVEPQGVAEFEPGAARLALLDERDAARVMPLRALLDAVAAGERGRHGQRQDGAPAKDALRKQHTRHHAHRSTPPTPQAGASRSVPTYSRSGRKARAYPLYPGRPHGYRRSPGADARGPALLSGVRCRARS